MERVAPRGLDVPLALMAAGLAEGHREEGALGGGERETHGAEAPAAAPSTDGRCAITQSEEAPRPTERPAGGRSN